MAAAAASTTVTNTVEQTQDVEIITRIDEMRTALKARMVAEREQLKEMVSILDSMEKKVKALSRKKRTRRTSPPQQYKFEGKVVKHFAKLGLKGDVFTRKEVMKAVSNYISSNDLKDKKERNLWTADATLAKILSVTKGSQHTHLKVNQLITPFFRGATKVSSSGESA